MLLFHGRPRSEQSKDAPVLPTQEEWTIDDFEPPPPSAPQQDADDPASGDGAPGFPMPGSEPDDV